MTVMAKDRNEEMKGQARLASFVIIGAMLGWMGFSWLGGQLGLPERFAFLADLAALAAFLWAGIVLMKVWRYRQSEKD